MKSAKIVNLDRFQVELLRLIKQAGKTNREIAADIGYENPNIISMFRNGMTRVPLDRVPALARSLSASEATLVRLWAETYEEALLRLLDGVTAPGQTPHERAWLAGLRQMFGGEVPPFTDDARAALRGLALARRVEELERALAASIALTERPPRSKIKHQRRPPKASEIL